MDWFWSRVKKTDTCWLWLGATGNGYGYFTYKRKTSSAHRYSYLSFGKSIPKGYHLDHLCRVRNCVNPDHLEPVTMSENIRRGIIARGPFIRKVKTHCECGEKLIKKTKICKNCISIVSKKLPISNELDFIQFIENNRLKNRIFKEDLCKALGISRQGYQKWIQNKSSPNFKHVLKAIDLFGCELLIKRK